MLELPGAYGGAICHNLCVLVLEVARVALGVEETALLRVALDALLHFDIKILFVMDTKRSGSVTGQA